ncbi:unnamed protein product [Ilex paraguariensis]|uniref:RMI1 N-terminal domain-containing protein n=1 Tax=Ilex paraguariensis TaxID=185542 RepID=A0ABC8QMU7_9AQUA
MAPRRLRMVCSSDADDEPQHHQQPPQVEEYDDDDVEIEVQEPTLNLETVTLNSSNPNPNPNHNYNPSEAVQLEISDDDFVDVPENFSPPPTPAPPPPSAPAPAPSISTQYVHSSTASTMNSSTDSNFEASDCPISGFLRGLGLNLRREWLDSCIRNLESLVPGFVRFDNATKAKLCFEQFLYSDMNYTGAGVLPENVHNMHLVDLPGPFVLQEM